jgi:hypothetical protein
MHIYTRTDLSPLDKMVWGAVGSLDKGNHQWRDERTMILGMNICEEAALDASVRKLGGMRLLSCRKDGRGIHVRTACPSVKESMSDEDRALAVRIIDRISKLSGRRFRDRDIYITSILARIGEDDEVDEKGVMRMVEFMWDRWGGDPDMVNHFNPTTLFRPSNFPNYYDMSSAVGDPREVAVMEFKTNVNEPVFNDEDLAAGRRLQRKAP